MLEPDAIRAMARLCEAPLSMVLGIHAGMVSLDHLVKEVLLVEGHNQLSHSCHRDLLRIVDRWGPEDFRDELEVAAVVRALWSGDAVAGIVVVAHIEDGTVDEWCSVRNWGVNYCVKRRKFMFGPHVLRLKCSLKEMWLAPANHV